MLLHRKETVTWGWKQRKVEERNWEERREGRLRPGCEINKFI